MMNKYEEALFRQKQLFCPHCLPEKTCDKCNLSKDFKVLHELIDKYEVLEKALNQACKYLETYDRKGNYLKIGYTVEEWKDELMKCRRNK